MVPHPHAAPINTGSDYHHQESNQRYEVHLKDEGEYACAYDP